MGGLFFHNVVWILESNDNPFPNLCFRKISFSKDLTNDDAAYNNELVTIARRWHIV